MRAPFNKPYLSGKELDYIRQAHSGRHLSGDGPFTHKCQAWLEARIGCKKALLTHSCTGALEMAALLAEVGPGDEVIMPSYTFVSTANAFVIHGGVPVFVDIRPDTLNIDPAKIEAAITPRTKAIVVVHYAGVACDMDSILEIAQRRGLLVIEDAAQAIGSFYKNRPLGSLGHLAALSFHETKNIIAGEGGALMVNDQRFVERAEILWEKGTNRRKFLKGQVDKYTWVDVGSSFLPSELTAAFLWAQLESFEDIMEKRMKLWLGYHRGLEDAEKKGYFRRPVVPEECRFNAHLYYLLTRDGSERDAFLKGLNAHEINAVFHYVPLHNSPAGLKTTRTHGSLRLTEDLSARVLRLPLWIGMDEHMDFIVGQIILEAEKICR